MVIFNQKYLLHAEEINWRDIFVRHVYQKLAIYEITIFKNKVNNENCYQFFKSLGFATKIVIDQEIIQKNNDSNLLRTSVQENRSNLYVLFESQNDTILLTNTVCKMLKLFTDLSPALTRPKVLLIYISDLPLLEENFQDLFSYAWSLQFLDFSILFVNGKNIPRILYFNPFSKTYRNTTLKKNVDIFPDKLQNMYQYHFKSFLISFAPYVEVTNRLQKNREPQIVGSDFPFTKIFCETANCTLTFGLNDERLNILMTTNLLEGTIQSLENNKININLIINTVTSISHERHIVYGKFFKFSPLIMIVPIIKVLNIDITAEMYVSSSQVCLLAIFIFMITRVLRLSKKYWSLFQIFKYLMGVAILKKPKNTIERGICLAVTLLSMAYSANNFSKLTEINLVNSELEINNLESVAEHNLTLLLPRCYFKTMRNDTNFSLQYLISEAIVIPDIDNCLEEMMKIKRSVCIAPKFYSDYIINKHGIVNGSRRLKLSKESFYVDIGAFTFEKASPFVTKFNVILQRIIESGIPESHHPSWGAPIKYKQFSSKDDEEVANMFLIRLLIILLGGTSVSIIVFIFEMMLNKK